MLMFICLLSAGAVTWVCGGIAEGRPLTRGNRERGYVMSLSPPKLDPKAEHFRIARVNTLCHPLARARR